MKNSFTDWIIQKFSQWLLHQEPPKRAYLCDFNKISKNIKPGDVLLIEGRSRISTIISHVTQSPWTHAALYIGYLDNLKNIHSRKISKQYFKGDANCQLLIESEIGFGTILSPLSNYKDDHIRILRPRGLTEEDIDKIINFTLARCGKNYDLRHIFDLARLLFPWGLLPRKWRSSLFQHNALQPTKDICSSLIADAFESIHYPILPLVTKDYKKELELIQRNPRLFTPSDFDYSPYFDVIKYPIFPLRTEGAYHNLPWMEDVMSDDDSTNLVLLSPEIKQFFNSPAYAVVGASSDRNKFGNKVLRTYLQKNKKVYPINPHEKIIEGISCLQNISELPHDVKSISIVTPPEVTEKIVAEAIAHRIKNIWMQPGSENVEAIQKCIENNINVIAKGPCILKELGFQE